MVTRSISLIRLHSTNCAFHIFIQFHLAKGVFITSDQALKIMNNKKPTLVGKDTAQAIWTNEVLACRSVNGGVAPNKRTLGETAKKKQLTPEKVEVVVGNTVLPSPCKGSSHFTFFSATVRYWGAKKKVNVDATLSGMSRILMEKIQDVRKLLKKLDAKNQDDGKSQALTANKRPPPCAPCVLCITCCCSGGSCG